MKHTPTLHVPQVISEGTEVYDHGYEFVFKRATGRIMTTATGATIPLFMSKSGLGWLKVRTVTDPAVCSQVIAQRDQRRSSVLTLGDGTGSTPSVGMPAPRVLTGVDLLRREHV